MKKFVALMLGLTMALSLAACGGSASSSAAASSEAASSEAAGKQTIFSLDDMADKTVGVQLGTTGDIYMSDAVGNADDLNIAGVEEYNKAADAVQALLSGKIDAVCIDDQVAKNFVAVNPDSLVVLDTPYATEDYAACVAKGNDQLTEAMNAAIAKLKENGTLDAILDKYINKTEGAVGYVTPEGTEYPNGELTIAPTPPSSLTSTSRMARLSAWMWISPRPSATRWVTSCMWRIWSLTPSSPLCSPARLTSVWPA